MSYHLNFGFVWQHFDRLLWGLLLSLEMAALSIVIGVVIGLSLALIFVSGSKLARAAVSAYVEIFRNVPLLLFVYLVFYGLPTQFDVRYGATTSFIVTLSIYAGAYLVEVFRAGLAAVPIGLIEAGKAIGLSPWQRLLHVRLPTMLRISLPALGNNFVSLFKDTSVAAVIAVPELTFGAQWINLNSFRVMEVFMVITVMYLGTGYALLRLMRVFERRFAVGRS
ncbi:MAG TPA: amino acid ABC transporter permease [Polyangia bacterium]|nr:amino acid ABC transporter permease [Polyangia bacterium]